jgi:hypothetical protein
VRGEESGVEVRLGCTLSAVSWRTARRLQECMFLSSLLCGHLGCKRAGSSGGANLE